VKPDVQALRIASLSFVFCPFTFPEGGKMILRAYLTELSLESLQAIAEAIGIAPEKKMSGKLVNEIDLKLFDRAYLKRLVKRLKEPEQRALFRLILAGPGGLPGEDRTPEAMRRLVHKGLAYAIGWQGRPVRYVMPEDIRESLSDCAEGLLKNTLKFLPKGPEIRASGLALVRDLFVFLSYVDHYGIALTGQGKLYRRTVRRILDRFEVPEKQPDTEGKEYPPRFGIIAGYSFGRKLVAYAKDRLQSTKRFEQWLALSDPDKGTDLLAYTLSSDRWLCFLAPLVINILSTGPPNRTVSLASFSKTMEEYGSRGHGGNERRIEMERKRVLRITQALHWLGVVALDADQVEQATRVALTPMGRDALRDEPPEALEPAVAEFFVQPNFEILVPRSLDLKLRHQLERFAELVSVDQMLTYRIERDSVYRAAERGLEAEEMLHFLETYSKVPLPQNLRYSISDWAGRYGEIQFRSAFLLCTQTPELAHEIKASKKLAHFIKGELSPSALIVPREKYPALVKRLQEAGYFPKTEILGEEEKTGTRERWWIEPPTDETFVVQRLKDVLDETDSRVPGRAFLEPAQF
jgi:hypothetical protein